MEKRLAHRAQLVLFLGSVAASACGPLYAAEAEKALVIEQSVLGSDTDPSSAGGAIYSPFSTTTETAASKPKVYASPPKKLDDGTPSLVATAVATLVAAGLFGALLRALISI
jgi:hypothetical protein